MILTSDGKLGLGTNNPQNVIDVEGSVAIGSSYSGTNTAPTNSLIVEGKIGVGTSSPDSNSLLDVAGSIRGNYDSNTTSFFGRAAIGYNGIDTDFASFSHLDKNNATDFALGQTADGSVLINAPTDQIITLRINDEEDITNSSRSLIWLSREEICSLRAS